MTEAEMLEHINNQKPVRFTSGSMPSCEGIAYRVNSNLLPDNTGPQRRWWVTLKEVDNPRHGRSAYIDVLEAAL